MDQRVNRMIDRNGYRSNVGIILLNSKNEVFWGKRIKQDSWQFPQGGIKPGESPEQAMYRELTEEVGLHPWHVEIIGRTRDWLRYEVPDQWIRRDWRGNYKGQKQIWYLLRLVGRDCDVSLRASVRPEFDAWRWNQYWVELESVVEFKRQVYRQALDRTRASAKPPTPSAWRQRIRLGPGYSAQEQLATRATPNEANRCGREPFFGQQCALSGC